MNLKLFLLFKIIWGGGGGSFYSKMFQSYGDVTITGTIGWPSVPILGTHDKQW